jgi:hypothetical protein
MRKEAEIYTTAQADHVVNTIQSVPIGYIHREDTQARYGTCAGSTRHTRTAACSTLRYGGGR